MMQRRLDILAETIAMRPFCNVSSEVLKKRFLEADIHTDAYYNLLLEISFRCILTLRCIRGADIGELAMTAATDAYMHIVEGKYNLKSRSTLYEYIIKYIKGKCKGYSYGGSGKSGFRPIRFNVSDVVDSHQFMQENITQREYKNFGTVDEKTYAILGSLGRYFVMCVTNIMRFKVNTPEYDDCMLSVMLSFIYQKQILIGERQNNPTFKLFVKSVTKMAGKEFYIYLKDKISVQDMMLIKHAVPFEKCIREFTAWQM